MRRSVRLPSVDIINVTGFLSQASLEAIARSYPNLIALHICQEDVDRTGSLLCFRNLHFPKLGSLSICCPLE